MRDDQPQASGNGQPPKVTTADVRTRLAKIAAMGALERPPEVVKLLAETKAAKLGYTKAKLDSWVDQIIAGNAASKVTNEVIKFPDGTHGGPKTDILTEGDYQGSALIFLGKHHMHQPTKAPTLRYWHGEFYTWSDGLWVRSPIDHKDEDEVYFVLGAWLATCLLRGKDDLIPNLPNRYTIQNTRKALAGLVRYHGDDQAWMIAGQKNGLIPVRNGLLDVDAANATLIDHDPRYFNTTRIEADWRVDLQSSASFEAAWAASETGRFLASVFAADPEQIITLQEFVGYLFGGSTAKDKGAIITGLPRSGKGTINRVLTRLLGPAACAPSIRDLAGDQFGLQDLLNKRLATITDARIGPRTDFSALAELLLSIIGGDPRNVKRKFMMALTGIYLRVIFLVLSNKLPGFRDEQGVLASRFIYFETAGSHLGSEDEALTDKLAAEADLWLAWAIRGLQRLLSKGPGGQFHASPTHLRLYAKAQRRMNPIPTFLASHVEPGGPDDFIDTDALFAIFLRWSQNAGLGTIGKVGFVRAVTRTLDTVRIEKREIDDPFLRPDTGQLASTRRRKKAMIGLRWAAGKVPTMREIAEAIDVHLPKETAVVVEPLSGHEPSSSGHEPPF